MRFNFNNLLDNINIFKSTKENIKEPIKEIASLPVNVFNSIFKRYRLGDYLPYRLYDDKNKLYINNDNSYGAIFECAPRIRMGTNTATAVEEILSKLPDGVFLQFMLFGSKNIVNMVENWRKEHLIREEELLQEMINATAEMYYEKTEKPINKMSNTRIKNYRLIISCKGDNKEQVKIFKNQLRNILESNAFSPEELEANKLKPILYELLNGSHSVRDIPLYDENMALNRQIISPNTKILVKDTCIEFNNKTWISLVPQSLQTYSSIVDFGEKLGDYISKRPEINQFQDNFFVTLSVCKLPKSETNTVKRNHQIISTQQWRRDIFRKFAAAQDESIEILDRIENGKETLFAMDLNILVAGSSFEEAERNAQIVKSYWGKGGEYQAIKLVESLGIHHLNFLASLPMGINEEYLFDTTRKYRSMFPKQIAQYAPLEADFKGSGNNFPLITRRSQFAMFDLFASNKSFNGYVVATSGAGKSVFLQTIAVNSYARGDRVFVLDYDNSFEGLCQAVNAQYVALNPDRPISFNPFSDLEDIKELKDDLFYFSDFIYMLGSNKNEKRAEEEEKLIKTRIQEVLLEIYEEWGNKMEITHIRDRLRQESDNRFQDFATQLGAFCRDGIYGKFFEGPNEFNIQKEFIAVEFKEMSEHPDIRDPIIMMLVYHINQMMYSSRSKRKSRIQIILDEAHRFLGKNPRMDDFIEQAYRRARKYDGSIILATQGFDDIFDPKSGGLSSAGKVIIANSPWKFFLTQTETSINMLIKSGVFNLDEVEENILKSIHTNKGQYSEIFIITPDEYKVPNRLIMNKFFYYVTTTDPKDKAKIAKYKEQGLTHIEAIKQLIKDERE